IYYDAGAVAIFAAAYALARQPIDMVANSINMGAFPEVVSRFDDEGPAASGRLLSQLMALMIRLCLPVAAMLVALTSDITQFLLPSEYHGRFGLLFPIIAFSVLCANLASFVYGTVVHAHKRPWLLIIANSFGSVATIALSMLLIPPMAEVGAALALAGGSVVGSITCIIISERLTPVPVPWRDIGVSVVISVSTGVAAKLASMVVGDVPAIFSLVAGGTAGTAVFFGLTSLFHPVAATQFVAQLRARLRIA
ncbi:MAG: polysaccharide biosynthesis protein, partial [Mesorhizobium sp.]